MLQHTFKHRNILFELYRNSGPECENVLRSKVSLMSHIWSRYLLVDRFGCSWLEELSGCLRVNCGLDSGDGKKRASLRKRRRSVTLYLVERMQLLRFGFPY